MNAARCIVLAALVAVFASCGYGLSAPAIGFRVESNVPDATVWVDDVPIGTTRDWSVPGRQIRAGFHRVEIRHPGYYSFFQEIDQPAGKVVVVNAQLHELVE
jgi:hypothetical protein